MNVTPIRARGVRHAGAVLVGVLVAVLVVVLSTWATAPIAANGQSASDGPWTLSLSQSTGLDPNGQTVFASGSGYDETRGIYVAFCVLPSPGQVPTPCGGGAGGSGSAWISSNPPSYGVGLATPYGPGGTFGVSVSVTPTIGSIDCRQVQCAVVTRNDHTAPGDRSQDVFVPVTFAAAPPGPPAGGGTGSGATDGAGSPGTGAGAGDGGTGAGAPAPDLAALAAALALQALPAPALTPAADGLSTTDGTRTLRAARVKGLANATNVRVAGIGYDPTKSIDVALSAAPAGGAAPSPCLTEGAAWVAAAAAPDGRTPTTAYGAEGTFTVEIPVQSVIASGIDCRLVACVLATHNDASRPNDRSQDLVIPVAFASDAAGQEATRADDGDASAAAVTVAAGDSGGSDSTWPIIAGVAIVAAIAGATTVVVRRRKSRPQAG